MRFSTSCSSYVLPLSFTSVDRPRPAIFSDGTITRRFGGSGRDTTEKSFASGASDSCLVL